MPLSQHAAYRKDKQTSTRLEHRHFATIAKIISHMDIDHRAYAARIFAAYLQNTNEGFDQKRFLRACEIDTLEYEQILRDQESMS